jgi:alpha-D-ribose 1-methylphosphonate 5-triphosphate synthase subunit PhnG
VDTAKIKRAAAGAALLGDADTYQRLEQALGRPIVVDLDAARAHRQAHIAAYAKAQALATLGVALADLER